MPAVVTDRGALPEVIEPNIAGIVSRVSVEELSKYIAKAISGDFDRSKIVESTNRRINTAKILDRFLNFLES